VLLAVQDYDKRGITYTGQRVKGQGHKPSMSSPQEYQIFIHSMETGLGLFTSMHKINKYWDEYNLPYLGLSIIRRKMIRLKPIIRRVKRRKQGNRDPNFPWVKASLR
jgi:hypothetical protein